MDYKNHSLEELYQIKRDIDSDLYPERLAKVMEEIKLKESETVSIEDKHVPDKNETIAINRWFARFLAVITNGGSFLGITIILANLPQLTGVFNHFIYLAFLFFYAVGIWLAIKLTERASRGIVEKHFVFWLIQIPIFMSPILGYQFTNGAFLNVWISTDNGLQYSVTMGSAFNFSFLQLAQPWAIGINLVAVFVTIVLHKYLYVQPETDSPPVR